MSAELMAPGAELTLPSRFQTELCFRIRIAFCARVEAEVYQAQAPKIPANDIEIVGELVGGMYQCTSGTTQE